MKARGILIASLATVLGVGTVAHLSGHAPKCPLAPLFTSAKKAEKKTEVSKPAQAVTTPGAKTVAMNVEQK